MNYTIIETLKRAERESKEAKRLQEKMEIAQFKDKVIENVIELLKEDSSITRGDPIRLSYYLGFDYEKLIVITGRLPHPLYYSNRYTLNNMQDSLGDNNRRDVMLPNASRSLYSIGMEHEFLDMIYDVISNEIPINEKEILHLELVAGGYPQARYLYTCLVDLRG